MIKKVWLLSLLCFPIALLALFVLLPRLVVEYVIIITVALCVGFLPIAFYLRFSNLGKQLAKRIRGVLVKVRIKQNKPRHLSVAQNVHFHKPQFMEIGDYVSIDNGAEFFPLGQYKGELYSSKIIIGNHVHIGSYNRFASMNCVEIEDHVLFAAFVHITDHSHEFRDPSLPIIQQGVFSKGPVKICSGAWLGYRCSILSGVTIGKNAVVAAGSVVTKDVPAYSVVAGCPAVVIKQYDFEQKEWVNA